MKLATNIYEHGPFLEAARLMVDLEKAGLDMVWVGESYTFDAISQVGYLAAITERVEIGTAILNVYSRSPGVLAMTAAGADYVSGGRFHLGIGASGPQVVEGFHGLPFERPKARIVDHISACRMVWRREPLDYHGATIDVPLPAGRGTGLGKALKIINHPVRANIPIWWASLMGDSVAATAQHADGWMPMFFDPSRFRAVWGDDIAAGLAKRDPGLGPLQIVAGGLVAIGEEFVGEGADRALDTIRRTTALYLGGMGTRERNFYNTIAQGYGFVDEAKQIQELYLSGHKSEAAAAIPRAFLEGVHLVGPPSYVAERLEAYREAGVTMLSVMPYGPDPRGVIEQLRELV